MIENLDNILVKQKDQIIGHIRELGDLRTEYNSYHSEFAFQQCSLQKAVVRQELNLVLPLWSAAEYEYKHRELTELASRAGNHKKTDGSW